MRILLWLVVACAAAVLASSVAGAAPSHLGPTGIVGTPTADVVGAGAYDVAIDYVKWHVPGGHLTCWPVRVVAGVSENVELGIGYSKWKGGSFSMKIVPVHVKAVLVSESETSPAVAVGIGYGEFKGFPPLTTTTCYLVATKTLSQADEEYADVGGARGTLRGSFGLMYNRYSHATCDSATKPFANLEYQMPGGATTLGVEYKVKEGLGVSRRNAVSSIVLRHMLTPNVWAQVGLTNAWYTLCGFLDSGHDLLIGVGYHSRPQSDGERN